MNILVSLFHYYLFVSFSKLYHRLKINIPESHARKDVMPTQTRLLLRSLSVAKLLVALIDMLAQRKSDVPQVESEGRVTSTDDDIVTVLLR